MIDCDGGPDSPAPAVLMPMPTPPARRGRTIRGACSCSRGAPLLERSDSLQRLLHPLRLPGGSWGDSTTLNVAQRSRRNRQPRGSLRPSASTGNSTAGTRRLAAPLGGRIRLSLLRFRRRGGARREATPAQEIQRLRSTSARCYRVHQRWCVRDEDRPRGRLPRARPPSADRVAQCRRPGGELGLHGVDRRTSPHARERPLAPETLRRCRHACRAGCLAGW